jgi:ADP-heptose:LPS heptosyltransferase
MGNPRILVIQLKRVGDVLVTTPVLPAIKKALPDAEIHFLVDKSFAPLLENNPFVDQIQVFDRKAPWITWRLLSKASYDRIIDFQSSPRSVIAGVASGAPVRAGFTVPFWGRFFKKRIARPSGMSPVVDGKMELVRAVVDHPGDPEPRRLFLRTAEREWARSNIPKTSGSVIGLIPTHRRDSRRWLGEYFVALARKLGKRGHLIGWFWGPGEKTYVEALQRQVPVSWMIPQATLRQMAAILERCRLAVANDNGPMHLAVAVGTPTVTIYGPTEPASWNPGGPLHRALQAVGVSCLGCNLNRCPFAHECMRDLSPEAVEAVCVEQLNLLGVRAP